MRFPSQLRCEPPRPQAPVYPVALASGGDPNSLSGLIRMSQIKIDGMRMMGEGFTRENRVTWYLEGMLHQHGRDYASPMDLEQPG